MIRSDFYSARSDARSRNNHPCGQPCAYPVDNPVDNSRHEILERAVEASRARGQARVSPNNYHRAFTNPSTGLRARGIVTNSEGR